MHIALDTNLPETDEAVELEELLGVEDAWRYLYHLWRWGVNADRQTGVVRLTPRILADACRWRGDPKRIFEVMTKPLGPDKKAWLEDRGDGYYYMRGWSRMGDFFKKRQRHRDRQKKYRESTSTRDAHGDSHVTRTVTVTEASRDAHGDSHGDGDKTRTMTEACEARARHVHPDTSTSTSRSTSLRSTSCSEPFAEPSGSEPEPAATPVVPIPLNTGPPHWVTQEDIDSYAETYPGIDPLLEAKKAAQWSKDNPTKRKTKRGVRAFLNSWMARAQDQVGRNQVGRGPPSTPPGLRRPPPQPKPPPDEEPKFDPEKVRAIIAAVANEKGIEEESK